MLALSKPEYVFWTKKYSDSPFLIGGIFEYTNDSNEGTSCGTIKALTSKNER